MSAKLNPYKSAVKIQRCRPDAPDSGLIAAAAAAVTTGEVICFPTTGLYGLGADATNPEAVKRVFEIKQRPPDRPVLILIDSINQLEDLVVRIPPIGQHLMEKFWPGKLTIVFEAGPSVPDILIAGTGRIGIRLPGHPVARAIVSELKCPLTGTSANISGEPGCHRISNLAESIANAVSIVIDCGVLEGGAGSTVVDVSSDEPVVLREGSITAASIRHH